MECHTNIDILFIEIDIFGSVSILIHHSTVKALHTFAGPFQKNVLYCSINMSMLIKDNSFSEADGLSAQRLF